MSAHTDYDDESTIDSRLDIAPHRSTLKERELDDTSTVDGNERLQLDDGEDETVESQREEKKGVQLTEEITQALRQFINLCEQIKNAKDEIKVLCERKAELEGRITQFMLSHDIPAFKTPNGKISVYQAKTTKPLNKDFLKETISAKITDAKMVEELTNMAFTGRPTVSTPKIKITPSKRDE